MTLVLDRSRPYRRWGSMRGIGWKAERARFPHALYQPHDPHPGQSGNQTDEAVPYQLEHPLVSFSGVGQFVAAASTTCVMN